MLNRAVAKPIASRSVCRSCGSSATRCEPREFGRLRPLLSVLVGVAFAALLLRLPTTQKIQTIVLSSSRVGSVGAFRRASTRDLFPDPLQSLEAERRRISAITSTRIYRAHAILEAHAGVSGAWRPDVAVRRCRSNFATGVPSSRGVASCASLFSAPLSPAPPSLQQQLSTACFSSPDPAHPSHRRRVCASAGRWSLPRRSAATPTGSTDQASQFSGLLRGRTSESVSCRSAV